MKTQTSIANQIQIFSVNDYSIWNNTEKILPMPTKFPVLFDGIFFFICLKGRLKLSIDLREYEIAEGDICIIIPGSIVVCVEASDDLSFHSLFFAFDFMSELPPIKRFSFADRIRKNPVQRISPEELSGMITYFSLIERQSPNKGKSFSDRVVKGLIYSLCSEIASIYFSLQETVGNNESSRKQEILSQFFTLLREHSHQERNVEFYADKMCLTSKYLSSSIKESTGKTVFGWINASSIIRAKILLRVKDKSIQQIAEELNFPNSSFFCRFFKKHTGMTPKEYRRI